ncbi:hypothetical protein Ddye_002331 [Dipteronia dyeriana]|uniref:RNase H type-1 domain-containing protein n=1 Tax=Dipteronia dyeriana TaxID=168575 RepID=A0AAD9XQQ4_9ROSI|nr:hypothetical protein Ddye_002331 [Dipteronia dyeriana]
MVSIHAGRTYNGFDKSTWGWSKCGNFSVKMVYLGQTKAFNYPLWKWKFIWGLKIPHRIKHFLWTIFYGKIISNHYRVARGLDDDPFCPRDILTFSVAWMPHSEDWIKLNIDESWDCGSSFITIKGFMMKKGIGNVLEAKLWAMFDGLNMAWSFGIRKIIVESDSLDCVYLLPRDNNTNHHLFSLIQNYKHLLNSDWICTMKHVYREGNRLADGLARMGHSMHTYVLFLGVPPSELIGILDDDCRGLGLDR